MNQSCFFYLLQCTKEVIIWEGMLTSAKAYYINFILVFGNFNFTNTMWNRFTLISINKKKKLIGFEIEAKLNSFKSYFPNKNFILLINDLLVNFKTGSAFVKANPKSSLKL